MILAPAQPSFSSSVPPGLNIYNNQATDITGLGGDPKDFRNTSSETLMTNKAYAASSNNGIAALRISSASFYYLSISTLSTSS